MGTWKQIAAVGAYYVGCGHEDVHSWSEQMLEQYGPVIRPFIDEIYTLSCQMCEKRKLDFSRDENDEA